MPSFNEMDLPNSFQIKNQFPLTTSDRRFIDRARGIMQELVTGRDERLALIVGPCSIHDVGSALEYGRRLKVLSDEVAESCICIMRVYVEKARTTTGWKGLLYDPVLNGSNDIRMGITLSRKLFLELTKLGIPIATEIVNPLLLPYLEDLISWGFIGARTSASQLHREVASFVPFVVGFKNSLDGNIEQAVHGVQTASISHDFPYLDEMGSLKITKSRGNPHTHVVLRGSSLATNYDDDSLLHTFQLMQKYRLNNRLLIDCSHGNCQKDHIKQNRVFHHVLKQFRGGNSHILGMMIESHLEEGNQLFSQALFRRGVSVTDPCIGWLETEELIRSASTLCSSFRSMR